MAANKELEQIKTELGFIARTLAHGYLDLLADAA